MNEWVVWGFKHAVLPMPIKLSGGALRTCRADLRRWESDGWKCAIYKAFTPPIGLREQAIGAAAA